MTRLKCRPFELVDLTASLRAVSYCALLLSFLAFDLWLTFHEHYNLVFALTAIAVLMMVFALDRALSIVVTLAYLFLMGDIRRILGLMAGWPERDLLLMVAPTMVGLLVLPLLLRIRLRGTLQKLVFAMMVWMLLEIVNPQGGGASSGVTGALFYVVPLLWFWVGVHYGTFAVLDRLLAYVLLPISICAAILGIYQTMGGFLPWESAWIVNVKGHYHALGVGSGIRPFGFSCSASEYASLLAIGMMIAFACWFSRRRVAALAMPLLGTALFLSGVRSVAVKCILAMAIVWAFRRPQSKGWVVRFCFGLGILVAGLSVALSHYAPSFSGSSSHSVSAGLAQHETEGLAHPLDSKRSTAKLHSQLIVGGIFMGLKHPMGYGLGTTSLASREGDSGGGDEDQAFGSDFDFSDMWISLGLVGGLLYTAIFYFVARHSISYAQGAPKQISLPVLAILVCLVGTWLSNQYSTAALTWFLIGSMSRDDSEERGLLLPLSEPENALAT